MVVGSDKREQADVDTLVAKVRAGDRAALGRAITLVESARSTDRAAADALVAALMPHAGGGHRVGITGVPGVGKSTFIEVLGKRLTGRGHHVAVLAVDPSSSISGGSILGDKTRMPQLARDPNAFIRPSPAAGALGGVARRSRETIAVCEAAGFDVVLVETVGVGQSEAMVADMVDVFVMLALAGGGDELQGIKRGILEHADLIAVTKADGDNVAAAQRARHDLEQAVRFLRPRLPEWSARVVTISALTGAGIDEIWEAITEHRRALQASGRWQAQRCEQNLRWMWHTIELGLLRTLREDPAVAAELSRLEQDVRGGSISPDQAAARLLATFRGSRP